MHRTDGQMDWGRDKAAIIFTRNRPRGAGRGGGGGQREGQTDLCWSPTNCRRDSSRPSGGSHPSCACGSSFESQGSRSKTATPASPHGLKAEGWYRWLGTRSCGTHRTNAPKYPTTAVCLTARPSRSIQPVHSVSIRPPVLSPQALGFPSFKRTRCDRVVLKKKKRARLRYARTSEGHWPPSSCCRWPANRRTSAGVWKGIQRPANRRRRRMRSKALGNAASLPVMTPPPSPYKLPTTSKLPPIPGHPRRGRRANTAGLGQPLAAIG